MRRRDDQIAQGDEVVATHAVVVNQRATGRFDDADTSLLALAARHQFALQNIRIVKQILDHLHSVQHLDHACPVVGERRMNQRPFTPVDELLTLRFGQWARNEVAVLHARERPDAIPAGFAADAAQMRKLHIGPGTRLFLDKVHVALVAHAVENDLAVGIASAQHTVVEVHGAVRAHER